jgi:malate/lactate dehydrogenase
MLRFASSPATYNSARNSFKVLRRLLVRNEPQHDHISAITKTKIHVPLIGFSHSQNNVPFAIANVAGRKLTTNLKLTQHDNAITKIKFLPR